MLRASSTCAYGTYMPAPEQDMMRDLRAVAIQYRFRTRLK
jgi:hypothetical protein